MLRFESSSESAWNHPQMHRLATPELLPHICAIWRLAWRSANPNVADLAPLEHWMNRAAKEFTAAHEVWVQEENGKLRAFHVLHPGTRWLDQLHVHPDHQGSGFGRTSLDQVCTRLPEGWSLHVAQDNLRARTFYEQFGLTTGEISTNPITGRQRVRYDWRPSNKN
jgi:putative acetyltransferase